MAFMDFSQTSVWKKSFELLMKVYHLSKKFPKEEMYGIIADMKRAANSVTHNFAEGYGRFESKDKTRFYKIARASCYELLSQTLVAFELTYLTEEAKGELLAGYKQVIHELDNLIIAIEKKK